MSAVKASLCLAMLVFVCALPAPAQKYPEKNVRLIVAFPTGASQILGLLVGEKLGAALGQPVVPDFRTGAGGNLAAEIAAKAPADGHTLLLTSPSLVISPSLYKKLGYDTMRDFAPVTMLSTVPNVFVIHPSVPAKNISELIKLAKTHPGKMSFGSGGVGSSNHLAGELFKSLAKVDILHVPYKGATPVVADLIGGQVSMGFINISLARPPMDGGRLRGLAVTTLRRSAALPELPALAEVFPGFEVNTWFGIMAPAGTPKAIVARLHAEIAKVLKTPDFAARLVQNGLDAEGSTPEEFAARIRSDFVQWREIIKATGIRAN